MTRNRNSIGYNVLGSDEEWEIALLAINNLVLAADVLLLPGIDLSVLQLLTSLSAVCVLLYAFIWDT